MTSGVVRTCTDRQLPDDIRLRTAAQSIDERAANAPLGNASPKSHRDRVRLALKTGRMWSTGRTLRVGFLDGDPMAQDTVASIANLWPRHANLLLEFVPDPQAAEIRIAFTPGASWSMIGTEALGLSPDEPTMNLGWLTEATPEQEWERVVLHEFGHALGCVHEHSSPAARIPWDLPTVYRYYGRPPNAWTKEEIDRNVIARYGREQTQFTRFDPKSIMIYPIPGALTKDRYVVDWNLTLSELDRQFIGSRYPFADPAAKLLVCEGPSVDGRIEQPGAVDLFRFEVIRPGGYVLETTGYIDLTLHVLGPGGETRPLADVSDGGLGGNVRVELALMEGDYRVEIRHRRPRGTGRYALTLHGSPRR